MATTTPERELRSLGDAEVPFQIEFTVKGVRDFFFNAPDVDEYEKREGAAKGRAKTEFDPETRVWRDQEGHLALPGFEFIKAMMEAGRGLNDPTKSGHRSMRPVVPKAMAAHEELYKFVSGRGRNQGVKTWDEIDVRLGRYNNGAMAPVRRPVLRAGWQVTSAIDVTWPEIFSPADVTKLMTRAGNMGVGAAKTLGYGRFVIVNVSEPHDISWT